MGDDDALDTLCRQHWICVYRIVADSMPDWDDAEEITQEVFAQAIAGMSTILHNGLDLCSCLASIARGIIEGGPETELPAHRVGPEVTATGAPTAADTSPLALADHRRRDVVAAMARLAERDRELLWLRYVEGLTVEDVAVLWGRSTGVVVQVQHRALAALGTELATGRWE
ncbi:MAG: RNA polymerase sigma factor [Acidimicrobiales bacterium]